MFQVTSLGDLIFFEKAIWRLANVLGEKYKLVPKFDDRNIGYAFTAWKRFISEQGGHNGNPIRQMFTVLVGATNILARWRVVTFTRRYDPENKITDRRAYVVRDYPAEILGLMFGASIYSNEVMVLGEQDPSCALNDHEVEKTAKLLRSQDLKPQEFRRRLRLKPASA
ncbi:hypothetical protein FJ420_30705 [Mesorhizobium sp. B3-1-3]|uniref:hypothetical protein n=1 Tax=unclassified Mesorhizobium TaxID=325217 RepID=UPI0011265551|nr:MULTISPECIES: hypothetical protein [unclassified Mesorhizobium]TPI54191.1 hypothetical protein FJ424_31345 [Mesorhizobium sp. B3-1-8]TPI61447.1 hypothetical protein FJ420_30705 [Mesorhizobium sp. B3-1-3]